MSPKAAAGQADLARDFDLAEAAGRTSRTGSVFGGSEQGAAPAAFPPPRLGLGVNPLGPHAWSTVDKAALLLLTRDYLERDRRTQRQQNQKNPPLELSKKVLAGTFDESS